MTNTSEKLKTLLTDGEEMLNTSEYLKVRKAGFDYYPPVNTVLNTRDIYFIDDTVIIKNKINCLIVEHLGEPRPLQKNEFIVERS